MSSYGDKPPLALRRFTVRKRTPG